jgi:hypothetical protein
MPTQMIESLYINNLESFQKHYMVIENGVSGTKIHKTDELAGMK